MKNWLAALLVCGSAAPVFASETCRQALALGLDVSGSVDAREYRLQLDGLARALGSDELRAALLSQPEAPVEILVFEWSGPKDQVTLAPWTRISDEKSLNTLIETLTQVERREEATPGTALGVAMAHGVRLIAERDHCWRKTLDISGDGKSNLGPRPQNVKPLLAAKGVTINALVVTSDNQQSAAELSAYFASEVILGTDAFVEVAQGFEDYEDAMQRKLLRELGGLVLSSR
ncbi:DUF1194 domain-containing protein [Sulfitobacter donghicola]|uniref:VWFA domain-containing protein n=1 Tax=Sulfitobacter donghicola DSW-25 = KCTC 12864 = JCM 14565 TaxID=1300350 RepID=A0A073IKB7_9RHOB|nr:DUF1194 domain-containing protein [Sulfitobacter donghicola]KEJ89951.1 hypothetical protein DSW25_06985 [Sulfitobacter donghicola DSW-25 = KCTC 12864 = JCM 14565]KIN66922.1 Von Willebrand factor type A domain protein [Sulfitobacter donghicola DSW-25 = KCTC 12864 = JCM 14565]